MGKLGPSSTADGNANQTSQSRKQLVGLTQDRAATIPPGVPLPGIYPGEMGTCVLCTATPTTSPGTAKLETTRVPYGR